MRPLLLSPLFLLWAGACGGSTSEPSGSQASNPALDGASAAAAAVDDGGSTLPTMDASHSAPGDPSDGADGGTTSIAPDGAPFEPAPPMGAWSTLGTGVTYRHIGSGAAVFLAYGGYTALDTYSQGWATELWTAKLAALGVGHLYAIKGPEDVDYASKEIANSALRAHLKGAIADSAPYILIAAHSSGAFVGNEILGQLSDAGEAATLAKTVYACLDGGGTGLTTSIVSELRHIAFVSARDSSLASGTSANASDEMELGSDYARYGGWHEVVLTESGCHDGAKWCLHDLLITHKPHDPDNFDLKDDYTDFLDRPPTVEWIESLAPYLR